MKYTVTYRIYLCQAVGQAEIQGLQCQNGIARRVRVWGSGVRSRALVGSRGLVGVQGAKPCEAAGIFNTSCAKSLPKYVQYSKNLKPYCFLCSHNFIHPPSQTLVLGVDPVLTMLHRIQVNSNFQIALKLHIILSYVVDNLVTIE